MTSLTINLPEPLHHQLLVLANQAGVSLNQYLINLLTRQTTTTYAVQEVPPSEVAQQRARFETLLQRLGTASAKLRVGEVLKQPFGVHYEVSTIGLLLTQLGLTRKQPTRRDYRQNPKRVAPWREETLPELKKRLRKTPRVIFDVDDSAVYLLPQVRQTWAPAGQTPILSEGCQSAHLSAMSAINEQGDIYFQLREMSDTESEVAKIIRDLCGLTQPKWRLI